MSIISKCLVEGCQNSHPSILGFRIHWTGDIKCVSVHNRSFICMPCINELHGDPTHQEHIKNLMIKKAVCEEIS